MTKMFDNVPVGLSAEQVLDLLNRLGLHIERIVSQGHSSPPNGWYEQIADEWVLVLTGEGR